MTMGVRVCVCVCVCECMQSDVDAPSGGVREDRLREMRALLSHEEDIAKRKLNENSEAVVADYRRQMEVRVRVCVCVAGGLRGPGLTHAQANRLRSSNMGMAHHVRGQTRTGTYAGTHDRGDGHVRVWVCVSHRLVRSVS